MSFRVFPEKSKQNRRRQKQPFCMFHILSENKTGIYIKAHFSIFLFGETFFGKPNYSSSFLFVDGHQEKHVKVVLLLLQMKEMRVPKKTSPEGEIWNLNLILLRWGTGRIRATGPLSPFKRQSSTTPSSTFHLFSSSALMASINLFSLKTETGSIFEVTRFYAPIAGSCRCCRFPIIYNFILFSQKYTSRIFYPFCYFFFFFF